MTCRVIKYGYWKKVERLATKLGLDMEHESGAHPRRRYEGRQALALRRGPTGRKAQSVCEAWRVYHDRRITCTAAAAHATRWRQWSASATRSRCQRQSQRQG